MDTQLWPGGPGSYEIHTAGGHRLLGRVWMQGAQARIEAKQGAELEGIGAGPYGSTEEAMMAIGEHTRGSCEIGNFET